MTDDGFPADVAYPRRALDRFEEVLMDADRP
jgi:hypothetical protein